jgi:glutamate dehydrogenase/leucine dehydrogenase
MIQKEKNITLRQSAYYIGVKKVVEALELRGFI